MKQFARLLLATVGFGVLGFVMSLVPQKNAGGAPPPGAPVSIINSIPLTVGVNNSFSQPVPTLGVEALTAFVADNSCAFLGTSVDCHIAPIYTVPAGQIAVIESVGGVAGVLRRSRSSSSSSISPVPTANRNCCGSDLDQQCRTEGPT